MLFDVYGPRMPNTINLAELTLKSLTNIDHL